ncbi:MAG: nitroreductase family protein [Planctomycetota bacterium]
MIESIESEGHPQWLQSLIQSRRTEKVIAEMDSDHAVDNDLEEKYRPLIRESVLQAGMAPFHFNRGVDAIAEPWRAHVLMRTAARRLAVELRDELGDKTKIPNMLAGCGAVILVTWLPEVSAETTVSGGSLEKQRCRDEEHLAATGAMVQNLLLLLTAHQMGTYWSSGGTLGGATVFERLGIDAGERLIAAVFVEFPEMKEQPALRKPGAQRDNRSDRWIREVRDLPA